MLRLPDSFVTLIQRAKDASLPVALVLCCALAHAQSQPQAAQGTGEPAQGQPQQASAAQEPQAPARPFSRLFGAGAVGGGGRQTLDFSASVSAAYTTNLQADGTVRPADSGLQGGGFYSIATSDLRYRRSWRRTSLDASGGASFAYYWDSAEVDTLVDWLNVRIAGSGRRTTYRLSQNINYQPHYGFSTFPGLSRIQEPNEYYGQINDFARQTRSALTFDTDADVNRAVGRHSGIGAAYSLHLVNFQSEERAFRDQSVGAYFQRGFSRSTALRLGYTYRSANYALTSLEVLPVAGHNIDLGLSYNRALGRTRRTTVSFNTGSSVLSTTTRKYYRAVGSASLGRQFRRTWTLVIDYQRGFQFVEGFAAPFFMDSVTFGTGGHWGRRVEFRGTAAYSNGQPGLTVQVQQFASFTGNASVSYEVRRGLAIRSDYYYYYYQFPRNYMLPVGLAERLNRQGVSVVAAVSLPVIR